MSDAGVSEEVSREHMMDLMRKKWSQINKLRFSEEYNNPLSWRYVDIMLNVTRIAHYLYNAGEDNYIWCRRWFSQGYSVFPYR